MVYKGYPIKTIKFPSGFRKFFAVYDKNGNKTLHDGFLHKNDAKIFINNLIIEELIRGNKYV